MNYDDFISTKLVEPADFNIGGVRVTGASLDFSNVSDEQVVNKGIRKVIIDLQDAAKRTARGELKDIKGADKAEYDRNLNQLAEDYSGATIDMAEFAGSKAKWDFQKGVGGDPVKKANAAIDKVSDADELLALQKKVEDRLAALGA